MLTAVNISLLAGAVVVAALYLLVRALRRPGPLPPDTGPAFRAALAQAPVGVIWMSGDGLVHSVNQRLSEQTGIAAGLWASRPLGEVLTGSLSSELRTHVERLLGGEVERFSLTQMWPHASGRVRRVHVEGVRLSTADAPAAVIYVDDRHHLVEDRDRLLAERQNLLQRLEIDRRAIEALRAVTTFQRELQACRDLGEAAAALRGLLKEYLPRSRGQLYLYGSQSGAGEIVAVNRTQERLDTFQHWGGGVGPDSLTPDECMALQRSGVQRVEPKASPSCSHWGPADADHLRLCVPVQAASRPVGVLCLALPAARFEPETVAAAEPLLADVASSFAHASEQLRLQEELGRESVRDPLTGLYNRRYLQEALRREIARAQRYDRPLAVIMLDLDHFKAINDRWGHDLGDQFLCRVAECIDASVRDSDVACRYGGEEFVLLLSEAPQQGALERAEALRRQVRELVVESDGGPMSLSASFGVACFPVHGDSPQALLRSADQALYTAKQSGRDRVVLRRRGPWVPC